MTEDNRPKDQDLTITNPEAIKLEADSSSKDLFEENNIGKVLTTANLFNFSGVFLFSGLQDLLFKFQLIGLSQVKRLDT